MQESRVRLTPTSPPIEQPVHAAVNAVDSSLQDKATHGAPSYSTGTGIYRIQPGPRVVDHDDGFVHRWCMAFTSEDPLQLGVAAVTLLVNGLQGPEVIGSNRADHRSSLDRVGSAAGVQLLSSSTT
ncbi:hypothetical protein PR003_g15675 [Phytophthora rubi]|uniref:Uncharacterized protein n=1 Tax=Phytophthora rubi TaxID=129364 RepID=A0A6A4EXJ8_9STRA|nr:hypothetical protein PR003_g15675 [Phytophthora rubi]